MIGTPEFFCAVLLVSRNPARLAAFYREVLGIPLKDEEHAGTEHAHYGCEVGDLHFAIHPMENFDGREPGVGSVKLAFEVFDMDAFLNRLKEHDVSPLYPPKKLGGTSLITAIRDPDGNEIEFTQLSDGWYKHIESRRAQGADLLKRHQQIRKPEGLNA